MIRLYRSMKFFSMDNILYDNEGFFLSTVNVDEFYGEFLDVIVKIDNAKLLDIRTGMFETPYGVCSKDYLSTGCKTVLNLIYIYRHRDEYGFVEAINATECGINAIELILDFIEKTNYNIGIIIEHGDNMFMCKERDYIIDNKIKTKEVNLSWICKGE